jgi:hypothetical protein
MEVSTSDPSCVLRKELSGFSLKMKGFTLTQDSLSAALGSVSVAMLVVVLVLTNIA